MGTISVLTAGGLLLAFAGSSQAATSVGLGTAESFAVLAGSGITNTGPTTVTGDIGTFPTTTITGSASITLIDGVNHAGDAVTQGAKTDLTTAYNNAAGQASNATVSADLGGQTLVPGVYTSASTLGLTGTLTLDAAGNSDAVFIFKAGSALTTASSSQVALLNGAQACNVFWQVGSSATLGTNSTFRGTILALTSITATTGAVVDGRLLASNGAVTLDANTITRSVCSTTTGDTSGSTPPVYPANIGPDAQGLICPWGGQLTAEGDLCVGTEPNSLMNPTPTSVTPTPSPTPTPTVTPTPTPTPTPTVTPTPTPTPTEEALAPEVTPAPAAPPQVPTKPLGGVDTGDNTTG